MSITFRAGPEVGPNIATTVEVDAATVVKSVLQEGLRRANSGAPLATVHLKVPNLMHMDAKCNTDSATDAGLAPWSTDKSGGTRWCHWMATQGWPRGHAMHAQINGVMGQNALLRRAGRSVGK